ncbi:MAG: aldo/keto reductase [Acidobacteria bacterium]|jgi:aryl-alcohol dehydrogenase-like predicted oxidoreductase|nr:MAG: aldo/keto reductase [Acidobacteriota bacterium]GIU82993.1 MAG: aldo/keto reductase [Pyrinomonadaceae bacterium]
MVGFATPEGTKRFSDRFSDLAKGHFRNVEGLTLSSIGIGTYLGNWDEETDKNYTDSIIRFVKLGGNVIDTAANYRFQRSERNIGAALKTLSNEGFHREELFICTKAGYLPFDGEPPVNVKEYFEENFVKKGIASHEDLVDGSHCMSPTYIQSQLEQSLKNMGIETIDLFYIHNPESQLQVLGKQVFEKRLAKAFEKLEENRASRKIRFYGVATWNGFRVPPESRPYHALEDIFNIAKQVGGENHGFRFIQLPYNVTMLEAYVFANQPLGNKLHPILKIAEELGVHVFCSASLLQGSLAKEISEDFRKPFGHLSSNALVAIQFVRSTPGVTTALVGMSQVAHVEENMQLAKIEPLEKEKFEKMLNFAELEQ